MIIIGGILHLLIGVFHLFFNRLFNYETEIKSLSFLNHKIALLLNIILTTVLFGFGIISILYQNEFTSTEIGKAFSLLIGIVWMFRACLQIYFFKLKVLKSNVLLVVFIFTGICYLV